MAMARVVIPAMSTRAVSGIGWQAESAPGRLRRDENQVIEHRASRFANSQAIDQLPAGPAHKAVGEERRPLRTLLRDPGKARERTNRPRSSEGLGHSVPNLRVVGHPS